MTAIGMWTGVFLTVFLLGGISSGIMNHFLLTKTERQIEGMKKQLDELGDDFEM